MTITDSEFIGILKNISTKETSADPESWTRENSLWGHCAVAALLAQDVFGGELIRGSLEDNEKYSYLRSHFWNRLDNGIEIDFTKEQYPDLCFEDLIGEVRTRERVLSHPDTARRYVLLKERFNNMAGSSI